MPRGPVVKAAQAAIWAEAVEARNALVAAREAVEAQAQSVFAREARRGFEAGRLKGEKEAAGIALEAERNARAFLDDLERSLPALVLDLVEGMIGRLEPTDALERAVRHALAQRRDEAAVTVCLAPADHRELQERLAGLLERAGGTVRLAADPALSPGHARLDSRVATVDLTLSAQLAILRRELTAQATPGPAPDGVEAARRG